MRVPINGVAVSPLVPLMFDRSSRVVDRITAIDPASLDGTAISEAVRLVTAAGRRLDAAHPCVDVQTAAGYRVHAVLPPISTGGTLLSVRFRSTRTLSLQDLVAAGTVHPGTAVRRPRPHRRAPGPAR